MWGSHDRLILGYLWSEMADFVTRRAPWRCLHLGSSQFQERKGFEKEFLHCIFCCKMYFLGLCALELLGNEQEIHDLGCRVGTPQFGELFMGPVFFSKSYKESRE